MPFNSAISVSPLSSVYGKIDALILAFPGSRVNSPVDLAQVMQRYSGIWEALDDRVRFYIYANHQDQGLQQLVSMRDNAKQPLTARELDHFIHHPEAELFPMVPIRTSEASEQPPVYQEFVQDAFVVMRSFNFETFLLEPENEPSPRNRFIADDIADQTKAKLAKSRYTFEGGNMLFGNDYGVIGPDTLRQNLNLKEGEDEAERMEALRKEMEEAFQLKRLVVPEVGFNELAASSHTVRWGKGWQALYHLDLYLTLGGRHPFRDEELIYVGDLVPYFNPQTPHSVRSRIDQRKEFDVLKDLLDKTAQFFVDYSNSSSRGPKFHVVRVPLIWENIPGDFPRLRSYNNCLVQYAYGKRTFFLPTYEDHAEMLQAPRSHERRVADYFSSYNSWVKWVSGEFMELADQAASLHCIVKVLERKP